MATTWHRRNGHYVACFPANDQEMTATIKRSVLGGWDFQVRTYDLPLYGGWRSTLAAAKEAVSTTYEEVTA